jgi:hypothetical protein
MTLTSGNINIHWSGNVSILIYSPLKLVCVADFLDRTNRTYM